MAKYRQNLPQLANRTFLSDGGMEQRSSSTKASIFRILLPSH
jgi:hypothetical protein